MEYLFISQKTTLKQSTLSFMPVINHQVHGIHFGNRYHMCGHSHRYTYKVLQTTQMKLILLCVWAEPAVLGSIKTALKLKYEIKIG